MITQKYIQIGWEEINTHLTRSNITTTQEDRQKNVRGCKGNRRKKVSLIRYFVGKILWCFSNFLNKR